jgi:electron transfer flavoprotein beta subunit
MQIVVLIKPVSDEQASDGWTMGSLDLYALSQAIAVRDATAGSVLAVAAGPQDAAGVLQRALASGADAAMHVQIENVHELSGEAIARQLHAVLAEESFDLIMSGQTSDDIETGTVGPMLAELLDVPHVSTVTSIQGENEHLIVKRDAIGSKQTLRVPLPALLQILSGREIPLKHPTPRGMIAARKKPTRIIEVAAVEDPGGLAWSAPELPVRSGDGEMLVDLPATETARQIVAWLQARGLTS